ncbi:MAG: hypothetical protein JNG88_05230 [Phycisphaerales bacterium]|nr:hypothetical protein [Phycisphaerales bacterium]
MPVASDEFDLAVIGTGPAAATAALTAARGDRSVALIRCDGDRLAGESRDWLGPAGVSLASQLDFPLEKLHPAHFTGVRLFSADFKRSCAVEDAELTGCIVETNQLCELIVHAAIATKRTRKFAAAPIRIEQRERTRAVQLSDGTLLTARVLIIADGATSPAGTLAGLAAGAKTAYLSVSAAKVANNAKPGLAIVLGGGSEQRAATVLSDKKCTQVSFPVRERDANPTQYLPAFWKMASDAGLANGTPPAEIACRPHIAGGALDRDTHVGKGCLIAGAAGGFAAAFSNEELYPAMQSGRLAAEVALRALEAAVLQDELTTFSAVWRSAFAEYLRMPNTDLNLLLPLVFGNPQMSRRVARAFLLGQKF